MSISHIDETEEVLDARAKHRECALKNVRVRTSFRCDQEGLRAPRACHELPLVRPPRAHDGTELPVDLSVGIHRAFRQHAQNRVGMQEHHQTREVATLRVAQVTIVVTGNPLLQCFCEESSFPTSRGVVLHTANECVVQFANWVT